MFKTISLSLATSALVFSLSAKAGTCEQTAQQVGQNKTDLIELDKVDTKMVNNTIKQKDLISDYEAKLDDSIKLIQANLQNPTAIKLALGQMKQANKAMNMQFLALHEAIQAESRRFQTLSNTSKARHDTALNAIRNTK